MIAPSNDEPKLLILTHSDMLDVLNSIKSDLISTPNRMLISKDIFDAMNANPANNPILHILKGKTHLFIPPNIHQNSLTDHQLNFLTLASRYKDSTIEFPLNFRTIIFGQLKPKFNLKTKRRTVIHHDNK